MNLKDLINNRNREEGNTLKREIIKTVIVVNLLIKNKSQHKWINIHNNFRFFREKECDLYFENPKEKEVMIFKIVKRKGKEKIKEIEESFESIEFEFFNNKKIFVLDMDNFSDNILEINEKIKRLI